MELRDFLIIILAIIIFIIVLYFVFGRVNPEISNYINIFKKIIP